MSPALQYRVHHGETVCTIQRESACTDDKFVVPAEPVAIWLFVGSVQPDVNSREISKHKMQLLYQRTVRRGVNGWSLLSSIFMGHAPCWKEKLVGQRTIQEKTWSVRTRYVGPSSTSSSEVISKNVLPTRAHPFDVAYSNIAYSKFKLRCVDLAACCHSGPAVIQMTIVRQP